MQMINTAKSPRGGYALITVLFSLAIITILLTSASRLNMNHARIVTDQIFLSNRLTDAESLLHFAIAERRIQEDAVTFSFTSGGEIYNAGFQDVGGLVDLNTASPGLLNLLLTNLGAENTAGVISQFQSWRQQGYQLQRTSDFARVTGLPAAIASELERFTTVKSGRRGIDPETAPLALLEILTGETGPADYLATRLPPPFRSPASRVNYHVSIHNERGALRAELTAHIPVEQSYVRILAYEM